MRGEQKPERGRRGTPLLEIATSAVGSLLAVGLVGYLVWDGLNGAETPADVEVRAGEARHAAAGWVLPVEAFNRGGETAAGVRVRATIRPAGGRGETVETEFDYVPGRSRREGALVFATDPASGSLDLRVTGWRAP